MDSLLNALRLKKKLCNLLNRILRLSFYRSKIDLRFWTGPKRNLHAEFTSQKIFGPAKKFFGPAQNNFGSLKRQGGRKIIRNIFKVI